MGTARKAAEQVIRISANFTVELAMRVCCPGVGGGIPSLVAGLLLD